MKNFTYIEEKKLIAKIKKVHKKIFSLPAKRFVICIIDNASAGLISFGYDVLNIKTKNIALINPCDLNSYACQFGDRLIIIRCECDLDTKNDITIDYIKDNQISITTKINFWYYYQYLVLFRETMENYYEENFKTTQLAAFESIIESLRVEVNK